MSMGGLHAPPTEITSAIGTLHVWTASVFDNPDLAARASSHSLGQDEHPVGDRLLVDAPSSRVGWGLALAADSLLAIGAGEDGLSCYSYLFATFYICTMDQVL